VNYSDHAYDLWTATFPQLAEQCKLVADNHTGAIDEAYQHEAQRLYVGWQEALAMPKHDLMQDFDPGERKASLLGGLRKRTIEILVKLRGDL
jgi:hypothetical protein